MSLLNVYRAGRHQDLLLALSAALAVCEEQGVEVISTGTDTEGARILLTEDGARALLLDAELEEPGVHGVHCSAARDGVTFTWIARQKVPA